MINQLKFYYADVNVLDPPVDEALRAVPVVFNFFFFFSPTGSVPEL